MDEVDKKNNEEVKQDSENGKEERPKPVISRRINIKVAIWSMITVFVFTATLFSSGILKQRNTLFQKASENPSPVTVPENLQPTLTPTPTPALLRYTPSL